MGILSGFWAKGDGRVAVRTLPAGAKGDGEEICRRNPVTAWDVGKRWLRHLEVAPMTQ